MPTVTFVRNGTWLLSSAGIFWGGMGNGLLLVLWLQGYIASELFVSNPILLISLVISSFKNGKNPHIL